jgi:hypothetical protein
MKCGVCNRIVVELWRDYESMDMLCDDCLDERLREVEYDEDDEF